MAKPSKYRMNAEDGLQITVIEWLNLACLPCLFWHTPNGGFRNKGVSTRLKRMGTKPGIPDLTFLWHGPEIGFIELKTAHDRLRGIQKRYLSADQKKFRNRVVELGARYAVCRSLDEVRNTLMAWGLVEAS